MFGTMFTPAIALRLADRPVPPEATLSTSPINGRTHAVGVQDMKTRDGLRFRIYYPGRYDKSATPAGWWMDSMGDTLKGHM